MNHLLEIWGADTPRIFIDIGASAVFGPRQMEADSVYWRRRFHGTILAIEIVPPWAEHLQYVHGKLFPDDSDTDLIVAPVRLGVVDREPERVFLTPGLDVPAHFSAFLGSGLHLDDWVLRMDGHGCQHHTILEQERNGNNEHFCMAAGNRNATFSVPTRRLDTLWSVALGRRRVDLMKVDFDPGYRHLLEHFEHGWRAILLSRAITAMVLEVDEPAYWANMPRLTAFFRRLDYYVFLKWPCERKRLACKTSYLPLSEPLLSWPPPVSQTLPHDLLILDIRQRGLVKRLLSLAARDCGQSVPSPFL